MFGFSGVKCILADESPPKRPKPKLLGRVGYVPRDQTGVGRMVYTPPPHFIARVDHRQLTCFSFGDVSNLYTSHARRHLFSLFSDGWDSAGVNARRETMIYYSHVFPKSPPNIVEYCRPIEIPVSQHTPPARPYPSDTCPQPHLGG